jgi:hypothetical protein
VIGEVSWQRKRIAVNTLNGFTYFHHLPQPQ